MKTYPNLTFKDLKPHIAEAIKESCHRIDVRIYKIANEVHNILFIRTLDNYNVQQGVDVAQDLFKIIDKTVKDSVALDCDLSIIVKGLLLGAFRASPFVRTDGHKTIRILIDELVQTIFKYNGDIKKGVEGMMTAIVIIAMEFKLNVQDTLVAAKEDILNSAKSKSPGFFNDVMSALPNFDDT